MYQCFGETCCFHIKDAGIYTHTFGLKEEASPSEMVVATYKRNYMVSKPKREKLSSYGYF